MTAHGSGVTTPDTCLTSEDRDGSVIIYHGFVGSGVRSSVDVGGGTWRHFPVPSRNQQHRKVGTVTKDGAGSTVGISDS